MLKNRLVIFDQKKESVEFQIASTHACRFVSVSLPTQFLDLLLYVFLCSMFQITKFAERYKALRLKDDEINEM